MSADAHPHYCPLPSPSLIAKRLASGRYRMTALGLEKQCSECKDFWPADSEFFYVYKTKGRFPDLWFCCKACYFEVRYPHGRPGVSRPAYQQAHA